MHGNRVDPAKLIALLANLIMLLGLCWTLIPEHRRAELGMRMSARMRRNTQRLAQTIGHWAIQHDLAGDQDAADVGYQLALRIMTGPHDTFVRWYEQARGVR